MKNTKLGRSGLIGLILLAACLAVNGLAQETRPHPGPLPQEREKSQSEEKATSPQPSPPGAEREFTLDAPAVQPDIHGPFAPLEPPEPPQAADTNAPANPTQSFLTSLAGFFTSFNTNLQTFQTNDTIEVRIGTATVDNANMTATFGVSANVYKAFDLEAEIRNTTALGTVYSAQGGAGYSFVKYDTKLTGYLQAGDSFTRHQWFIAPGIRVSKALTDNTFTGIGIELPIYLGHPLSNTASQVSPTFTIFTGFKL